MDRFGSKATKDFTTCKRKENLVFPKKPHLRLSDRLVINEYRIVGPQFFKRLTFSELTNQRERILQRISFLIGRIGDGTSANEGDEAECSQNQV